MKLIDIVNKRRKRLVFPLMGYTGVQLTKTTIRENLFNAETYYRTISSLVGKFEPDVILPFMDVVLEADALGIKTQYPENDSPSLEEHPIKSFEDLNKYAIPNPRRDGRMPLYIELCRMMVNNLDDNVLKGAYIMGPYTLASQLVGTTELSIKTIDAPKFVESVVKFSKNIIIEYGRALINTGINIIFILDPFGNTISPSAFERFSGKYLKEIVGELDTITVLHICGNSNHLIERICATGVQGINIDSPVELAKIANRVPDDIVMIGNVSPVEVMLQLDAEGVKREVAKLLDSMQGIKNFILCTGCECPPATPLENIKAFMEMGRKYG